MEYGEDLWKAMLEKVGYKNAVFRTHHIYPDDLIMKLADAAVILVGNNSPTSPTASTKQDFLRFFGRCFVRYFSHYCYEKFIKVSHSRPTLYIYSLSFLANNIWHHSSLFYELVIANYRRVWKNVWVRIRTWRPLSFKNQHSFIKRSLLK